MSKTTGIEIMTRLFDFLSGIEESNPTPVSNFVALELTGNEIADNLLSQVALMMLQQLKSGGIIKADDLSSSNPKIYGLTQQGVEMKNLFFQLTSA